MKTLAKTPLQLVLIPDDEFMPGTENMEFGKFYYSREYQTSSHLCVCGCGLIAALPIKENEWNIKIDGNGFSITPSILHRHGCKSHYIITNSIANLV